ncbi:hypothetical protein AC1031_022088 [Aphanomyces cochlioides]|nr:hypothetical protein AC1031_022088 [Aphanomyces cochlioides]
MEDALATIHYFVSNFPASVISSYLDSLDSMLRRTVDPPISHPILHQIHAHSTIASEKIVTWSQTLEALSVVLGFSTQVTPFLHSFSAAHVASLLDKDQLERSYATFVHHIYTNLARVLEPLNMTPHALADDMLTLCAVLHTEHPIAATTCLEKCRTFHPSLAFEAFVAHMREIYMVGHPFYSSPSFGLNSLSMHRPKLCQCRQIVPLKASGAIDRCPLCTFRRNSVHPSCPSCAPATWASHSKSSRRLLHYLYCHLDEEMLTKWL